MDDKPGFIKQFISSLFGRYERIGGGTPEEWAAFRAAYQSVQDDPAFINQFAQQNPDLVNEDSKKPYSVRGVLTRTAIVIAVFEEVFRRDLLSNLATFHHRKSMLAKLKKQFDIMMKRRVQLQDAVMRNAEKIKGLTAEQRKLLEEMRQLLDQYHNLSNQYSNLMDELMGLSTRLEALEVERIELKESVWKLHVDIHEGITNARQQLSEILPPNSRLLIAIAKLEQEKVEVNKEESLEDLHESNKNALEELRTLQQSHADELDANPEARKFLDTYTKDIERDIDLCNERENSNRRIVEESSAIRSEFTSKSIKAQNLLKDILACEGEISKKQDECQKIGLPIDLEIDDLGPVKADPDKANKVTPLRKSGLAQDRTPLAKRNINSQSKGAAGLSHAIKAQVQGKQQAVQKAIQQEQPHRPIVCAILQSHDVPEADAKAMTAIIAPKVVPESIAELDPPAVATVVREASDEVGYDMPKEKAVEVGEEIHARMTVRQAIEAAFKEADVDMNQDELQEAITELQDLIPENGEIDEDTEFELLAAMPIDYEFDEIELIDSIRGKLQDNSPENRLN